MCTAIYESSKWMLEPRKRKMIIKEIIKKMNHKDFWTGLCGIIYSPIPSNVLFFYCFYIRNPDFKKGISDKNPRITTTRNKQLNKMKMHVIMAPLKIEKENSPWGKDFCFVLTCIAQNTSNVLHPTGTNLDKPHLKSLLENYANIIRWQRCSLMCIN